MDHPLDLLVQACKAAAAHDCDRGHPAGAVAPVTVLVNGTPVPPQPRGPLFFSLDGAGFARVTVIDGSGAADSVVVWAEESASAVASQPALGSRVEVS